MNGKIVKLIALMCALILTLAGCGSKAPAATEARRPRSTASPPVTSRVSLAQMRQVEEAVLCPSASRGHAGRHGLVG